MAGGREVCCDVHIESASREGIPSGGSQDGARRQRDDRRRPDHLRDQTPHRGAGLDRVGCVFGGQTLKKYLPSPPAGATSCCHLAIYFKSALILLLAMA